MTQGNMNLNLEVYLKQEWVLSCIITSNHIINTIGANVTCDFQTNCYREFQSPSERKSFFAILKKKPKAKIKQPERSNFVQPCTPVHHRYKLLLKTMCQCGDFNYAELGDCI